MYQTASVMPLHYCSVSPPIPRRDSCFSMVRFHGVYAHPTLLNDSALCAIPNCTAHIPLFLYPFLNTTSKTRPFEYLRLTSLGVIGALVKVRHLIYFYCIGLCSLTLQPPSTAKRQLDRDPLPPFDGDNPSLSADYGDRF